MTSYRYLFADLQTGAVQAELPLSGVSIQRLINGSGRISGSIPLSDSGVRKAFDEASTQPGRTSLTCLRNNEVLASGILWIRRYAFASSSVIFGASEWYSALMRRKVASDHAWNAAATETAVSDLIADAQSGTNGSFGMTVTGATGTTVTASVISADRQWAGGAIEGLLSAAGVDYETNASYSGTLITPYIALGSPQLGRTGLVSGLTVAEPIDGEWVEDATEWATRVIASSNGGGSTALTATQSNAAALADGFPRWDWEVASGSDQSADAIAIAAASALADRAPGGAFGPVTCRATDPDVSEIRLGDVTLITLPPSERFPDGLSSEGRITGWTLRPGESGGTDALTLEVLG